MESAFPNNGGRCAYQDYWLVEKDDGGLTLQLRFEMANEPKECVCDLG